MPRLRSCRRGGAKLWLLAVAPLLVAACSTGVPSASGHHPTTTSGTNPPSAQATTTVATAPSPSLATCAARQLRIGFRGTQGSTGNYFAAFWVADSSTTPCALPSNVEVSLLNSQGNAQLAAHGALGGPIALSPNASIPPVGSNPQPEQTLADVTLEWPTVFDSASSSPPGSAHCRDPEFSPSAVRFTFSGVQPLLVTDLQSDTFATHGFGALCGPNLTVINVSAL